MCVREMCERERDRGSKEKEITVQERAEDVYSSSYVKYIVAFAIAIDFLSSVICSLAPSLPLTLPRSLSFSPSAHPLS